MSEHTAAAYRRDLTRYTEFLTGRGITDAAAVDRDAITDFASSLSLGEGDRAALAPSSVARAVVAVRGLHRFGLVEGITTDNPAARVQPPTQGTRLPKALTLEQVQALLDAPDTTEVIGVRDAALLEMLYGTGARISEIVALDVDDVARLLDTEEDSTAGLRLIGKGNKERIVPLGSFARRALQAWLVRGRPALATRSKGSQPALFLNQRGGRLSRQSAWAILQTAAKQAKIGVEVSPHTLRHCFATHLLDGGADVRVVQELLGHASVTTTQIYTLVTVDHLRQTYLTAHPRAR